MLSEHVVMGPSPGAGGIMGNPRDYAAPGNQDPATPWPDSVVLASAIAAATTRIRIALAAVIAPLRHPLLLAKQLATLDLLSEGRLVVQPTVSWHEDEYRALGVPFRQRGAILDEQLVAMGRAWRDTPAAVRTASISRSRTSTSSRRRYRPEGPRMWFGGMSLHEPLLRRIVRYGHGFHPFGTPTPEELERLRGGDGRGRPRHRRAGDDRRHPRPVRRRQRRPPTSTRPLASVPGAARGRLHGDLLQAVDVHRRSSRGARPLPPRRRPMAESAAAVPG